MAISPTWSFDGGKIAFTLIGSRSHYLGICPRRQTAVHTLPCTSVVSPGFCPTAGWPWP
jgi:TolB protein